MQQKMKDWIWWQKFGSDKATYVDSYYNINHNPVKEGPFKSTPKFVSSLTGSPFNIKPKIGF